MADKIYFNDQGTAYTLPEGQGRSGQYQEPIGPQQGITVQGYLAESKPEWKPNIADKSYVGDNAWDTIKGRAADIGRQMGSLMAYGKDRAKQNVAYGIDAIAGWLAGDKDGRFSTEGINARVPANDQDWLTYDEKREDYKSDKDMPYTSYTRGEAYDPSKEYANFTDTDAYNLLDAENISGGKVGRAIGDFINKLGGNFESTPEQNEMAFKKGIAAAQGIQGYLGDTLPEQLEMLLGEMGLRGAMATLGPAFVEARKLREEANAATKAAEDAYVRDPLYTSTPTHEMSPAHEAAYNFAVDKRYDAAKAADRIKKELAANAVGRRYAQNYEFPADVKQKLTTDQYHNLMTKVGEIANKHEQVARAMRETDNLDEFNRLKGVLRDLEDRANRILPDEAVDTRNWLRQGDAYWYSQPKFPDKATGKRVAEEARQLAEDIQNAELDGSDNRATRLLKDIWGL